MRLLEAAYLRRSMAACAVQFCLAFALQAQAQMQMNVEQLAEFVRSELALRQGTDKQLAAYVKKLQLTEKLTDKTILDLEAQGAGPKTVQALQELRDRSVAQKAPGHDSTYSPATAPDGSLTAGPPSVKLSAQAPVIPPPDSVQQQNIIDLMRQYALSYTKSLPNFICVEVMRRYIDPNAGDHFRSLGNVLAKVSYNEGQEKYQVFSINGHYEDTTLERAAATGGAISSGEFGSLMSKIFESRAETEFGWDHWATLRGKRMAVFSYFIDSGHSDWSITYGAGQGSGGEQRIITAYSGLIYADENTGEIDRIKFKAVNVPKSFPISDATETLDYDQVQIGGQPYVCPLRAVLNITSGRERTKNEIEFRSYRRFGTESGITYGAVADLPPLPASQTEEQPANSTAAAKSTAKGPAATPAAPPPSKPVNSSWSLPTAPPPPPPQ